jgi:HlyD family secretion protein
MRRSQQAQFTPVPGASREVWLLRHGAPVAVTVRTGISNGRQTEITGGDLTAGMAVIVDYQEQAK